MGSNEKDGNTVVKIVDKKTYKSWKRYTEFKLAFHLCAALLYMGIHSEETQKMGERLAYFQVTIYEKPYCDCRFLHKISSIGRDGQINRSNCVG